MIQAQPHNHTIKFMPSYPTRPMSWTDPTTANEKYDPAELAARFRLARPRGTAGRLPGNYQDQMATATQHVVPLVPSLSRTMLATASENHADNCDAIHNLPHVSQSK
jgi:hypothetical protein